MAWVTGGWEIWLVGGCPTCFWREQGSYNRLGSSLWGSCRFQQLTCVGGGLGATYMSLRRSPVLGDTEEGL